MGQLFERHPIGMGFGATAWAKARREARQDEPRKRRRIDTESQSVAVPVADVNLDTGADDGNLSGMSSPGTLSPEPEAQQQEETEEVSKPEADKELRHPDFRFYLHRPRARSKLPVLIPLKESTTLAEALRGRTVLEFPTLYVLGVQDDIAEKYVLDEQYLAEHPEERDLNDDDDDSSSSSDDEAAEPLGAALKKLESLDEQKVLEVLKQDLCTE